MCPPSYGFVTGGPTQLFLITAVIECLLQELAGVRSPIATLRTLRKDIDMFGIGTRLSSKVEAFNPAIVMCKNNVGHIHFTIHNILKKRP